VARRLDKLLPSHWQERVKARLATSYPDFLRMVLAPGAAEWESTFLWYSLDIAAVLARWTDHLGPDRVTVVVSDAADRTALPRAFEQLLDLPEKFLAPRGKPANESLDLTSTELVRRINRLADDERWSAEKYRHVVQLGIVDALKRRPEPDPRRLGGVPAWALEQVAERADAQVEAILASGVRIIGDPEQLRVRGRVQAVDLPAPVDVVSLDLMADTVAAAVDGATRLQVRKARRASVAAQPSAGELLRLLSARVIRRVSRS